MILRRPYALLIKNFRLIHIVMAVMMAYLTYRTSEILSFISDYIGSSQLKVSSDKVQSLYGSILFVLIAFVIVLSVVILLVLRFKKKPIKFYIYNIIAQVYSLVMYSISYSLVNELQYNLIDIKTLKLVQDFTLAALAVQIIAVVIVTVRATGFDIKGFNFKEDLNDLEIIAEDNEEVEVSIDIDTDKLKRGFKKRLRYAKYIYLENKFLINIIGSIVILIGTYFYLTTLNVYSKTYSENDTFKTNEFMIQINEAYRTQYDYKGNKLFDDFELVAIRIKVRKLYLKKGKLNTGRFILKANDNNYYHVTEYNDELKDLGKTYMGSKISLTEDEDYILVFKVNEVDVKKNLQLRYTDTTGDVVKVNIKTNNLNETKKMKKASLGDTLTFKDSILGKTTFKIDSFEIGDRFRLDYKYCYDEECYDSIEYVSVSASDNYNKTLLKLVGQIKFDDKLPIDKHTSLFRFMNEFVTIKYKIASETKRIVTTLRQVKAKKAATKNTYFIEVPGAIKNAEKIDLEINVRNKVYNYTLK